MKNGSGYIGSPNMMTSTENLEIIPQAPLNWSIGYSLYKFAFYNQQECHVKINNNVTLYLTAGQGFAMDQNDRQIDSFVIIEDGIEFNWIGAY